MPIPEDSLNRLTEYEEFLLENKSQIKAALDKSLYRPEPLDSSLEWFEGHIGILGLDREPASKLTNDVVNLLANFSPDIRSELEDEGLSTEYINFIQELSINHRYDILTQSRFQTQGKNSWSHIDSYITDREGHIGFTHDIILDNGNTLNLTTSVGSLMQLISHFARKEKEAIEKEGENAAGQVNPQYIRDATENVLEMLELLSQYRDDLNFAGSIDAVPEGDDLEIRPKDIEELMGLEDESETTEE